MRLRACAEHQPVDSSSAAPQMDVCFRAEDIPLDLIPLILDHIHDRRDLHTLTLVSRVFNSAATPLLYRTLDSRVKAVQNQIFLFHPSTTILSNPKLARHVRHVTETGAVHAVLRPHYPDITHDTLEALKLCTNLESFTWIDDSFTSEDVLFAFLNVVATFPVQNLTIRTYSDLGERMWKEVRRLRGLKSVAIWCMEGPPRVLQGWSETLGTTLTHLELGRCAGVPPTILISVFANLPLLRTLRLKGAPSAAIPIMLSYLPNLVSFDTEYLGSGNYRQADQPLPFLRHLTVRTSSMDSMGPQELWLWIRQLTRNPSLESFVLNSFSAQGMSSLPRSFILDLAEAQRCTLKEFLVGMTELTLKDMECLATVFPLLEHLDCCVASPDADAIGRAVANANNLRSMRLTVQWTPEQAFERGDSDSDQEPFTIEDAKNIMLRKGSQLRTIAVGSDLYKGEWALRDVFGQLRSVFEVRKDVAPDSWI